ncbi:Acetyltransferase (isoleucine patch superfamily) [Carnobacterium alterfunditum]|uniref:Acetyltransferase (Isoleucine patch superfamily) n=1 Tax=Carnobacterium alterfunditum TaxID=28230 RepID=A0A1N6HHL8_9LACT|nr:CatB-related O-acetyltransferase [Carnobacterium alterfunditum]SIO19364.1 Acetyltransferase (isoleucine patch superfamily) [Carnobacterium alterfunditum]
MIYKIIYMLKIVLFKKKWRKVNKKNFTTVSKIFPLDIVKVGTYTYGVLNIYSYGSKNERLSIGSFVSIASDVTFMLGGNHMLNTLSTYPFRVMINGEEAEAISKGEIIINDDVWIGTNSIILSGVRVGKGAVIGAGSIVTKDVPPYAIVGGNPAKIIKFRFSKEIIEQIIKIDLSYLTEKNIKSHIDDLYIPVTKETLSKEVFRFSEDNY